MTVSGKANVTVAIYGSCDTGGDWKRVGSVTYQAPAQLTLRAPMSGGGEVESNPFSMYLQVGTVGQEGSVTLWSAFRLSNVLLQYWTLGYDGTHLSGSLTDNHAAEGAAEDYLDYAPPADACNAGDQLPPVEQTFGPGSALKGTLGAGGADLKFTGGTSNTVGYDEYAVSFEFISST